MQVLARRFRRADADFCFRCRAAAFIIEFRRELTPAQVAACVNAYMPEDFVRMSDELEFFVLEIKAEPVGFVTIKRVQQTKAEIPLIYLSLAHIGKGVGRWCIQYVEDWIASNWPDVSKLFLDTVIPEYNGGFYRKLGFEHAGETECEYLGERLHAVRFEKTLGALNHRV